TAIAAELAPADRNASAPHGAGSEPQTPADPCTFGLLLLAEAQRKGQKPTIGGLAKAIGVNRQALYANKEFAQFRDMANKLFGLFDKEAKKGDWQGPHGSMRDGRIEAEDPAADLSDSDTL